MGINFLSSGRNFWQLLFAQFISEKIQLEIPNPNPLVWGVFVGGLTPTRKLSYFDSHASARGFEHEATAVLFCDYCDVSRRYFVHLT